MYEKMTKELFELSQKVLEAGGNISFSMEPGWTNINTWNGDRSRHDGYYKIYKTEMLAEESKENFLAAKEHLERLIRESDNEKE